MLRLAQKITTIMEVLPMSKNNNRFAKVLASTL